MNRRQFRPTLSDRLEDRLVMSSSGHGLNARAAQVVVRQAPGVDPALIKVQVDQAFYWLQSNLQSGISSLLNNYNYPPVPADPAAQRASIEVLRAAASSNIALLADQVGLIIAPLRGSNRLEPLVRDRLTGTGPGSLATAIDASLATIPPVASASNGFYFYSASQLIPSATSFLVDAARLSADNLVAAFTSGGANGRHGSGHAGRAALNRARGAVNQAFASFASDFTSTAQSGLGSLTYDPTYYSFNGPIYSSSSAVTEPVRRANVARVGRLVTQVDAALAPLPGAAGRLQPYARNEVGGLDRGSLLFSLNTLVQNLAYSTNSQVPPGTQLPPPLGYTPTQYVTDVGHSLIELDRSATVAILAAYEASPGLRR